MRVHTRGDAPSEISLPITPMLDMSFQLMFFFIMTFNPSKEIELPLPIQDVSTKQAKDPSKATAQATPKIDETKNIPIKAPLTLTIEPQTEGFTIGVVHGASNTQFGSSPKEIERLTEHLTKIREGLGDDQGVQFEAKRTLKWRDLFAVRDACLEAGYRDFRYAAPGD